MLVPHSEPCSTTLRCSRPTTRALCRRALCGADLSCKKSIQVQAAQAADCSPAKLDNPTLTRPLPLPGIMSTNSGLVALTPGHNHRIARYRVSVRAAVSDFRIRCFRLCFRALSHERLVSMWEHKDRLLAQDREAMRLPSRPAGQGRVLPGISTMLRPACLRRLASRPSSFQTIPLRQ
jgi:hypothetical protein